MGNRRSNVVNPKSGTPKTTKMDHRVSKPANRTGKAGMVYPSGSTGKAGNGLK
jgi:hypothetical protein